MAERMPHEEEERVRGNDGTARVEEDATGPGGVSL